MDAYVTCTPYVVRLTGDGTGALGSALAFQLYLPPYLGSASIDFIDLVRRPDGNPAPLLLLQHSVGSFGRQLCISYELDSEALICSPTSVEGPLAVGDLNGALAGVPPDEIVTALGADKLGVFGFAPVIPTYFTNSVRTVPGSLSGNASFESAAVGDLNHDGRLDVLVGQPVNSLNARVDSIHSLLMGATELAQVATPLPSTPGVDAVAIADVDGDGCNDIVGAGAHGQGIVHLAAGTAGGFDGGRDLPQLGYQNPATATRVSMAVADLTGDRLPEIVIADVVAHAVMAYGNHSTAAGGACVVPPPPPPPAAAMERRCRRRRRSRPRASCCKETPSTPRSRPSAILPTSPRSASPADWAGARDAFAAALPTRRRRRWTGSASRCGGSASATRRSSAGARRTPRTRARDARAMPAGVAVYLAGEYRIDGRDAESAGWLARARRLLADAPPGAERGWLAIEEAKRAADFGGGRAPRARGARDRATRTSSAWRWRSSAGRSSARGASTRASRCSTRR